MKNGESRKGDQKVNCMRKENKKNIRENGPEENV
jgi:hypothetical protein